MNSKIVDLSYAREWYTKLAQCYEGVTSEQFAVYSEPAAQVNLKSSFSSLIVQVLSFKVAFSCASPDSLQSLEKIQKLCSVTTKTASENKTADVLIIGKVTKGVVVGISLLITLIEKNDSKFLGSLTADKQSIVELFREIKELKDSVAKCLESTSISVDEINTLCEKIATLSANLSELTKHIGIKVDSTSLKKILIDYAEGIGKKFGVTRHRVSVKTPKDHSSSAGRLSRERSITNKIEMQKELLQTGVSLRKSSKSSSSSLQREEEHNDSEKEKADATAVPPTELKKEAIVCSETDSTTTSDSAASESSSSGKGTLSTSSSFTPTTKHSGKEKKKSKRPKTTTVKSKHASPQKTSSKEEKPAPPQEEAEHSVPPEQPEPKTTSAPQKKPVTKKIKKDYLTVLPVAASNTGQLRKTASGIMVRNNWIQLFFVEQMDYLCDNFPLFNNAWMSLSANEQAEIKAEVSAALARLEDNVMPMKRDKRKSKFGTVRLRSTQTVSRSTAQESNNAVIGVIVAKIIDILGKHVSVLKLEFDSMTQRRSTEVNASLVSIILSNILVGKSSPTLNLEKLKAVVNIGKENVGKMMYEFMLKQPDRTTKAANWTEMVCEIWSRFSDVTKDTNEVINRQICDVKSDALDRLETSMNTLFWHCAYLSISFIVNCEKFDTPLYNKYITTIVESLQKWIVPSILDEAQHIGSAESFVFQEATIGNRMKIEQDLLKHIKRTFRLLCSSIQNFISLTNELGNYDTVTDNEIISFTGDIILMQGTTSQLLHHGRMFISLIKTLVELQTLSRREQVAEEKAFDPSTSKTDVLLDTDNTVKGGTFYGLVCALTDPQSIDMHFQDTFFGTYDSFCTTADLLEALLYRYNHGDVNVRVRVAVAVTKWTQDRTVVWDNQILNLAKTLRDRFSQDGQKRVTQVLDANIEIKEQLLTGDRIKTVDMSWNLDVPELPLIKQLFIPEKSDNFESKAMRLATQIAIIDSDLFSKIEACELFNQNWNKPERQYMSRNLMVWINTSTSISYWIAWTILSRLDLVTRTKVVAFFIDTAECLYELHDFNGLMSVLAGLQMNPISRLKHTFAALKQKSRDKLDMLNDIMDPSKSYKRYRLELEKQNKFCVPFAGASLKDLTFIDDGNNDFLNDGVINFKKREMVCRVALEYKQFVQQNFHSTLLRVEPLHLSLLSLPHCGTTDNNTMYSLSMCIEPRGATKEQII